MVHLTCNCLNIHIDINEASVVPLTKTEVEKRNDWFPTGVASNDSFFGSPQGLAPVTLALGGISIEIPDLTSDRKHDQWVITECGICSLATHAVKPNSQNLSHNILVNAGLERDASRIIGMRQSQNYSPVFRVILDPNRLSPKNIVMTKSPVRNSAKEQVASNIQNRVSQYIREEQNRMEERIRTFTEQCHSQFAALQLKVSREKDLLIRCLENQKTGSYDVKIPGHLSPLDEAEQESNRIIGSLINNQSKIKDPEEIITNSSDSDDPVEYEMEDPNFAYDQEPWPEASDESNSSGDQPLNKRQERHDSQSSNRGFYATSLPITVPPSHWTLFEDRVSKESEDENEDHDNFHNLQIPGHLKKAQMRSEAINRFSRTYSVTDGTELFGDLPRPPKNYDLKFHRPT